MKFLFAFLIFLGLNTASHAACVDGGYTSSQHTVPSSSSSITVNNKVTCFAPFDSVRLPPSSDGNFNGDSFRCQVTKIGDKSYRLAQTRGAGLFAGNYGSGFAVTCPFICIDAP